MHYLFDNRELQIEVNNENYVTYGQALQNRELLKILKFLEDNGE